VLLLHLLQRLDGSGSLRLQLLQRARRTRRPILLLLLLRRRRRRVDGIKATARGN
jgi:hypothetical protein